jgi:aminoglycoside phosphotransferase (APT) family kinase protein
MSLVDTLATLHAVDPESVGLGDFGRPAGFLERQVRRWQKQLDASRSRDVPGIDLLHDRLAAAIPTPQAATILHGDYRLDNTLVLDDKIQAVLDWEMSTLGDPLADIGLMIAYSTREAPDDAVIANVSGAPGYPSTDEVIARYASRSGLDVSALDWYIAFAFFKLAVITEGIYYRFSKGQTVGVGFEGVGALVAPVVAQGNATLKEN